jgi:hypothetical protein
VRAVDGEMGSLIGSPLRARALSPPGPGWLFLRVGRPDPVRKEVHELVDAALCPEHAAELERNLKQPVDPALLSDPEGRA